MPWHNKRSAHLWTPDQLNAAPAVGKRVHVALAARVFIKPSFVEDVADEITCGSALSLLKQLLATQQVGSCSS